MNKYQLSTEKKNKKDDVKENEDILLYPNPIINNLTIQNAEVNLVEIYDTKLSQLHINTNKTIDMSHFRKGIYFIKMTTNLGHVVVKKVVKN